MGTWNYQHAPDCQVTADRADLLDKLRRDPDNPYLRGALPEYDNGGDQEAENCTCDWPTVARLISTWGANPQEVGAVDGTEDDFGDLINDAVIVAGYDPDAIDYDGDQWQRVQEAAQTDTTSMGAFVDAIRAALAAECGAMFEDHAGNACRCTKPADHPGSHVGVVVTEATGR